MSPEHEVVFLFDVDDTLLDNDAVKSDFSNEVRASFGTVGCERFWAIYEEQRKKHGYSDLLGTLERFRLEHLGDPLALSLSAFVMGYPFAEQLFPDALAVVRHASSWGLPVILTDGDGVFQPYKLQQAGLWQVFEGRVLDYVHKETELAAVERAYPAGHYVVVDDKLSVLNAIKKVWGDRVTTVFVRQGHYARDAQAIAGLAPADLTLERIGELMTVEFSAFAPV